MVVQIPVSGTHPLGSPASLAGACSLVVVALATAVGSGQCVVVVARVPWKEMGGAAHQSWQLVDRAV